MTSVAVCTTALAWLKSKQLQRYQRQQSITPSETSIQFIERASNALSSHFENFGFIVGLLVVHCACQQRALETADFHTLILLAAIESWYKLKCDCVLKPAARCIILAVLQFKIHLPSKYRINIWFGGFLNQTSLTLSNKGWTFALCQGQGKRRTIEQYYLLRKSIELNIESTNSNNNG